MGPVQIIIPIRPASVIPRVPRWAGARAPADDRIRGVTGARIVTSRRMLLGECTSGEPGAGSPRGAAPAREFSSKPSVPFETEAQAADSVRGRPGRTTAPTGADRIWADARALGIPRECGSWHESLGYGRELAGDSNLRRRRVRPMPGLRSPACSLKRTLRGFASFAPRGFLTMLATRCVSSWKRVGRWSRSWSAGRRGARTLGPSGRACRSSGCDMCARLDSGRSTTTVTRDVGSATRCSPRRVGSTNCSGRSTATRSASSGVDQRIRLTPNRGRKQFSGSAAARACLPLNASVPQQAARAAGAGRKGAPAARRSSLAGGTAGCGSSSSMDS
jgi:hypothetical protein